MEFKRFTNCAANLGFNVSKEPSKSRYATIFIGVAGNGEVISRNVNNCSAYKRIDFVLKTSKIRLSKGGARNFEEERKCPLARYCIYGENH